MIVPDLNRHMVVYIAVMGRPADHVPGHIR